MKIVLINHSEEYAVREIVNAFYPKLKLNFCNLSDILTNQNYIISECIIANGKQTYKCTANIEECMYEYIATGSIDNRTLIKKSIAECLKKATDIHLPWGLLTGIRPSKIVREYRNNGGKNADKYLVENYETDIQKAALACQVEENESKHIINRYHDGISLYVGIPFCPTRCLYCSFTSQSIAFSNKLTEPYVNALKHEINEISKLRYIKSHTIETVYFGGGTPTALTAAQIDDVLSELEAAFDLGSIKELTFEAGRPDTITEEKLLVLRKHGISRICINPQTINDKTLRIIGRKHTAQDFIGKYHLAKTLGFTHVNCDIIAGLPEENEHDFANTLSTLEQLNPESITVHTMSIKHGSNLDMNYDMYSLSAANTVNNMLSLASDSMKKTCKMPYYMYRQKNMLGNLENVGYCSQGHECLYNIYIMEEVQPIIALGAGGSTKAVSGNMIERVFNVKEVSEYINRIDEMIERKRQLLI